MIPSIDFQRKNYPLFFSPCRAVFKTACMAATLCLALLQTPVEAIPLPTEVSINGLVSFDSSFANTAGNVTLAGEFFAMENGVNSGSSFSGTLVTGDNPVTGLPVAINDGFGMQLSSRADFDSITDSEYAIGIDLEMSFENTSASNPYQIQLRFENTNNVNADGADSYATSDFSIDVGGKEIFFSDLTSDTAFGDKHSGAVLGSFGDSLSHITDTLYQITLDPGTQVMLVASYTGEGAAYFDPGASIVDFSHRIRIDRVINLGNPIPIPGSLLLFLSGFIFVALRPAFLFR